MLIRTIAPLIAKSPFRILFAGTIPRYIGDAIAGLASDPFGDLGGQEQ
jgi:hypothetical protein